MLAFHSFYGGKLFVGGLGVFQDKKVGHKPACRTAGFHKWILAEIVSDLMPKVQDLILYQLAQLLAKINHGFYFLNAE